ncbi:hypothetical protein H2136_22245 [Aeromonas hydrophila]|uniref:Glycosyltransferase family 9 protein n=1 Tax=Aeromonas hydrophila TaxID=644 RepID=A0A926FLY9_AERHY|nr:hypothetical protein [Aeromonas hydrophila]
MASLFVSGDTGPLHLAAASGVPCLGLFTQTDPARYGCLGAQHLNLVIGDRNAIPSITTGWPRRWQGTPAAAAAECPSPVPSPGLASGAFVVTPEGLQPTKKREGLRLPRSLCPYSLVVC